MKAALLHKPYEIRVEDVEEPKIGPEDVLLEQVHTGICGSDVNRYKGIKEMGETIYRSVVSVGKRINDALNVMFPVFWLLHGVT